MTDRADTIAHDLMGTCDSLEVALERHGWEGADHDHDFCYRLDSIAFECVLCGWWFPVCEMSDDPDHDWCCEDCVDDPEEMS